MAKKNRRAAAARPTSRTRPGAHPGTGSPAGAAGAVAPDLAPAKAKRAAVDFVARPFEGLPGEADWVALREIVPAASATVHTTAEHGARAVTIVSLLPDLMPALRRTDGELLVALQTVGTCGDASRDVAHALLRALELEPGEALSTLELAEPGPRLQDVLDLSAPFAPQTHTGFDYWLDPTQEQEEEVAHALEHANEAIVPTAAVAVPEGLGAAYWCRMNGKEFLRWVVPAAEEETLDALARLHARHASQLEDGVRLIGAFRTCGVLVPVWELARGSEAEEVVDGVARLGADLADALATTDPLSSDERRARAGLVSRQVNLR